jgi:biotin carboxyl carrier protein
MSTDILSGQIVNLRVCPTVWADLSFEVSGIVQQSNATLGQQVTAFDFDSLYATLGQSTETVYELGPSRLAEIRSGSGTGPIKVGGTPVAEPQNLLNSDDLQNNVASSILLSLRAESIKALLDKACALRANVYYGKYSTQSQTNLINYIKKNYTASTGLKPANLSSLQSLATEQYNALHGVYKSDPDRYYTGGTSGVVKSTSSHLKSTTASTGSSQTTGSPTSTGTETSTQTQNMTYTDYGYRVPDIECNAQNLRAQTSLIDEQYSQLQFSQYIPNLESVFGNQLTAIDMDVKQLQVAYLNTILLSPINGVVTGVYKQVGDRVIAGETVLRVEDNSAFYLVGVVVVRGVLTLNQSVTVTTTLFSTAPSTVITGQIVAVRGDESGDDRWQVVILVNSITGGQSTLPLNYYFDFDDTSITVQS